jgi:hypothetical protein
MHQPSPFVVNVDIARSMLRSIRAACVVMVSWIHPPAVRCGCLPLGCLTRHLNRILLGLALFVRGVEWLPLDMRLAVWVCRIEGDPLSILICSTHNLLTLWVGISNDSCNCIDIIETSIVCSVCCRGMRSSRVVSCKGLSSDNSTHYSSLLLIRRVLPLRSLSTILTTFWRMERSAKLAISTTNRSMALTYSTTINHLSFLLIQNLLSERCWDMTCWSCSSCS